MKYYWKLTIIVPLIVICIVIYYIKASDGTRQYYLKTLAGNENEVSSVSLHVRSMNEAITIDSKGSKYEAIWEKLTLGNFNNPVLERLVKENHQFMRGKGNVNAFYEDNQILGYVNVQSKKANVRSDFYFEVYLNDKTGKGRSSFKVNVPNGNMYNHIIVNDVQIEGQTLKLITFNSNSRYNFSATEIHQYTLELGNRTITNDRMILSDTNERNNITNLERVEETDPTKPSQFAIFRVIHRQTNTGGTASSAVTPEYSELFVLDKQSGKLETIQAITERLKKEKQLYIVQSEDSLYLTTWNEPNMWAIRYNLAEKRVIHDVAITNQPLADGNVTFSRFDKDRIYMMILKRGGPQLAIADLRNGEVVYQGVVTKKDQGELRNFGIENIVVKPSS